MTTEELYEFEDINKPLGTLETDVARIKGV